MAREPIGHGECINCGALVAYRLDKQGRAYFRCTGGDDPERRACGLAVLYFGPADTKKLVEKFKGKSSDDQDRRDDKREPARVEPAKPAKPKREPAPAPAREPEPAKRSVGGYGGLYDD